MTIEDLPDLPDDFLDDPSTSVAAAFIHDGDSVDYSFHHSWDQLRQLDLMHGARLPRGGLFAWRAGTDGLADARNSAVRQFLTQSEASWLWWVDTDMGFAPDTVERLLEAADSAQRPVVGALCFANRDVEDDGMGGRLALAAPVILDWKHIDGEAGFDTRWNYPQNAVVRCDGTGSACVLIHRSVFERIAETYGPNWYSRARNPSTNQMISEDLSFCARLMALSIPVFVHTGVKTTHAKRVWLSEEHYWQQRALNSAPTAAEGTPLPTAEPTWTVPRYAIVPTHNRPARLLALVVSLGTQCDRIVVLDNASTPPVDEKHLQASVPEHCAVEVIRDEQQPPNLARFWNVMFDRCAELAKDDEAWDVAVFNDDSVVPAGWYDATATAMRQHETAVVAHTGDRPVPAPDLLTDFNFERSRRMAPHAFVVRGEVGLRADESMQWWYFDDDFCRQAIQAGGVLAVPGPVVVNAQANSSTFGPLAEQAQRDRETFEAKWSR